MFQVQRSPWGEVPMSGCTTGHGFCPQGLMSCPQFFTAYLPCLLKPKTAVGLHTHICIYTRNGFTTLGREFLLWNGYRLLYDALRNPEPSFMVSLQKKERANAMALLTPKTRKWVQSNPWLSFVVTPHSLSWQILNSFSLFTKVLCGWSANCLISVLSLHRGFLTHQHRFERELRNDNATHCEHFTLYPQFDIVTSKLFFPIFVSLFWSVIVWKWACLFMPPTYFFIPKWEPSLTWWWSNNGQVGVKRHSS